MLLHSSGVRWRPLLSPANDRSKPAYAESVAMRFGQADVSGHVGQSGAAGRHHCRPTNQAGRSMAPGRLVAAARAAYPSRPGTVPM